MSAEKLGRCLVTGASGFIGRSLCASLQSKGIFVRALLRKGEKGPWDDVVIADLGKDRLSRSVMNNIDTVFHLAGKAHALEESKAEVEEYHLVNVKGTEQVLEVAQRAEVKRFVLFSSTKAMGEGGDNCLDETSNLLPETPYGYSKKKAEDLVLQVGRIPHVCVLRLSMVYGNSKKGNLYKMIRAVKKGFFPPLPPLKNKRSMVHVDDVVGAAILAAGRPESVGEIFILTDGRPYSTSEIYEWICVAVNKNMPSWYAPLGGLKLLGKIGDFIGRIQGKRFIVDSDSLEKLTGSSHYTSEKIENMLGFKPEKDLKSSMLEIVQSVLRTH